MRVVSMLAAVSAVALLGGCATIFTGSNQDLTVNSTPDGANVTIVDGDGTVVFSGTTPAEVEIERGDGFFKSHDYIVTIEKAGLPAETINLKSKANGWTFGNIVLGGIPGILIDGATGAIYRYDPNEINVTLGQEATLRVGSPSDLTESERETLVPIS